MTSSSQPGEVSIAVEDEPICFEIHYLGPENARIEVPVRLDIGRNQRYEFMALVDTGAHRSLCMALLQDDLGRLLFTFVCSHYSFIIYCQSPLTLAVYCMFL